MSSRARSIAIAVTPLVAMATLAAGLRVGAPDSTRAAIVLAAPAAHGSNVLAWQIHTLLEDRRVRESISVPGLVVTARSGSATVEWRGDSNADGIAEARLAFGTPEPPREVWVEVRDGRELLAAGSAAVPAAWTGIAHASPAHASRRDGTIAIDVMALGGRLAAGFPGSLWVRTTDRATGAPLGGVALDAEPEPGLDVTASHVVTCANGWAELVATPTFHVTGLSLHAKKEGKDGFWYGGAPVAAGASHVAAPMSLSPGAARGVEVTAGGARATIYAEVDDAEGRLFATTLTGPKTTLDVPPLAPGLYWIVTSNDPRDAETASSTALARPVLVSAEKVDACALGAKLATSVATGFPRTAVVDGFSGRSQHAFERRRLGTAIGLSALVLAALLEGLLISSAARRAKADLPRFSGKSPAGSLAIALLVALLGFALVAALLLYRAT
jgi:hypothetical protein